MQVVHLSQHGHFLVHKIQCLPVLLDVPLFSTPKPKAIVANTIRNGELGELNEETISVFTSESVQLVNISTKRNLE